MQPAHFKPFPKMSFKLVVKGFSPESISCIGGSQHLFVSISEYKFKPDVTQHETKSTRTR